MSRNFVGWVSVWTLALLSCLFVNSTAWAQKNNRNKQSEKRENERVANAQKEVRREQEDLNDAQEKLRGLIKAANNLEEDVVKARNHYRETREQVADELAKSQGIDAALARLKDAKAELAAFSKPVIDQLHQSPAWLDAKKSAEQAKTDIDKLRGDLELSEADSRTKIDQLTKIVLLPNELEKQAIAQLPEGKRLNERVMEALAAIEKIRRSLPDEKIDADPSVVKAKKASDELLQKATKHGQSINAARADLRKSQLQLQQAKQRLQQAQAADARK